jgi:hypothetical protein
VLQKAYSLADMCGRLGCLLLIGPYKAFFYIFSCKVTASSSRCQVDDVGGKRHDHGYLAQLSSVPSIVVNVVSRAPSEISGQGTFHAYLRSAGQVGTYPQGEY